MELNQLISEASSRLKGEGLGGYENHGVSGTLGYGVSVSGHQHGVHEASHVSSAKLAEVGKTLVYLTAAYMHEDNGGLISHSTHFCFDLQDMLDDYLIMSRAFALLICNGIHRVSYHEAKME